MRALARLGPMCAMLAAVASCTNVNTGGGGGGGGGSALDGGATLDGDTTGAGNDGGETSIAIERFGLGARHGCIVSSSGSVRCWGGNDNGQLGVGNVADVGKASGEIASLAPVDLGAGARVAQVVAGDRHTCALLTTGHVKCWGDASDGQLGNDSSITRGDNVNEMGTALPEVLLTGRTAVQIASGSAHACAVLDDGSLRCWGRNASGQLGLGDSTARGARSGDMAGLHGVDLGVGRTVKQVACGESFTCARLDDGSVKCFGNNQFGQLGVGDVTAHGNHANDLGANLTAVAFGAGLRAVDIALGATHACATLDDGTTKCWGRNESGQLGLGDTTNRGTTPSQLGAALARLDLGAGRAIARVRLGNAFTCAQSGDGTLRCFGLGADGQLGSGATSNLGDNPGEVGAGLAAVDLGAGRRVTTYGMGGAHVCAELDDQTVKCWGLNVSGQLGLGDTNRRGSAPNEMGSMLPVVPVAR